MIIINLKLFFHLFVSLFISSFETIQVTTTEVEIMVIQMYYIRPDRVEEVTIVWNNNQSLLPATYTPLTRELL